MIHFLLNVFFALIKFSKACIKYGSELLDIACNLDFSMEIVFFFKRCVKSQYVYNKQKTS